MFSRLRRLSSRFNEAETTPFNDSNSNYQHQQQVINNGNISSNNIDNSIGDENQLPPPAYTPYDASQLVSSPIETSGNFNQFQLPSQHHPYQKPQRTNSLGGDWVYEALQGLSNLNEDPLEFLTRFDTVFLIDDSGSMAGGLWESAKLALSGMIEISTRYDPDGIDIYFLNNPAYANNVTDVNSLKTLFDSIEPRGSTPTGTRMEDILLDYCNKFEDCLSRGQRLRPLNFIIVTDGPPIDDPESVIINTATRLDKLQAKLDQVGIQFIQVGEDPEATVYLHELDDELHKRGDGCRDIVDTTPATDLMNGRFDSKFLLKAMLGGINKRLDRISNVTNH